MSRTRLFSTVIVPILAALFSGVGVLLFTSDWETTARSKGWVSRAEWEEAARRDKWVPLDECPAFPISVKLTSPGDRARVSVSATSDDTRVVTDIVVKPSRPLPAASSVGLVVNEESTSQYYVLFPSFSVDGGVFRARDVFLGFKVQPTSMLNIWALVVAAKGEYGGPYSSIEQIRAIRDDSVLSQNVIVSLSIRE